MVATGRETSVRDMLKLVMDITNSGAEIIYTPKTGGGVSRMCADLTLAGQKLNYRSSISLEDGLRLTLARDPRLRAGTGNLSEK